MNVFRIFSIGAKKILSKNCFVQGTVTSTALSSLRTLKKPVRLYTSSENTLYSHYITFQYTVDSVPYTGKLFVDLRHRCPQTGETIDVYYDPAVPKNYACYNFGSSGQMGW